MKMSRFPLLIPLVWAAAGATLATDVRDIELRRLFDPTQSEMNAERSGRIYIYEGLRDVDVKRAMEEEFDRVDSMMFIREQVTDEKGEVKTEPTTGKPVYQDDGC